MNKTLATLMTVLFTLSLATGAFAAEWVSLSGARAVPAAIRLVETTADRTVLELDLAGFAKDRAKVDGTDYLTLDVPGASRIMRKGLPDLPKVTCLVAIPDGATPTVKVLSEETVSFKLDAPVLSSKGHLTRDVDPAGVKFAFDAAYKTDAFFPADKAVVDPAFKMRDLSGVRVVLHPVRYNPVTRTLEVARKMTVQVGSVSRRPAASLGTVPFEFERIYRDSFINYTASPLRATTVSMGKFLIVTLDALADAVQPLVDWKRKIGWEVEVVKFSTVGKTADELKKFIQAKYDADKVGYIMLVGDVPEMPTLYGLQEKAASDPCYVKLSGADNVPDASICRICVKTPAEAENQVAKFVHYEQFPFTGADAAWYRKGMGIASNQGDPTDFARANQLRDAQLAGGFTSIDQIYDPSASKAKVAEGVNDGRSVINYIGHGSETMWVTSSFSNSDVDKLANGRKFPVIWSVACVNGKFTMSTDCFAERWMKLGTKDAPRGAATIFASSTNAAWVPPCDMQSEIIKEQMLGGKSITVGGQALKGILKGMEIWGTADASEGNQLNEQYNLFGDGTLVLRTAPPQALEVRHAIADGGVAVTVTAEGKPLAGAWVTLTAGKAVRTLLTDETGAAKAAFAGEKLDQGVLCTVYGKNVVPVVDRLLN